MSITRAEQTMATGTVISADEELAAEQQEARARARAAQRRSKMIRVAIRIGSLVVVLGGWEYFGRQTNPILFTYPTAVANAAVKMIASGELWKYLSQSLIVLFAGLGLAAILGIALGLVMARFLGTGSSARYLHHRALFCPCRSPRSGAGALVRF